jgi:hypothetical protein
MNNDFIGFLKFVLLDMLTLDNFLKVMAVPAFFWAFICLSLIFIMCLYLNLTKRRDRIVELAFSKQDEYFGVRWVGLYAAFYIFPPTILAAYSMYIRFNVFKQKNFEGLFFVRNIHNDKNYEKLLNEFPLFKYLSLLLSFSMLFSVVCLIMNGFNIKSTFW